MTKPTDFPFWIDLNGLMQRWNTNLIVNITEAVKAGLPVYYEPQDVELTGMDRLSADEWYSRTSEIDPGRIRFSLQELLQFEKSHFDPWEPAAWVEKPLRQVDIAARAGVTAKQVRNWQKREDFPDPCTPSELDAWLKETGLGKAQKTP